ncbi:serine hydrolase domain-containing protein [Cryptosporangium aurantiacum]|uniref:CubicO group peptidase, beta-lactamase class C family n=1 Tax=Cryptosporangium aurantiacum TaxID=134849 RepID=A0A1M7QFU6_9ACTN|nr:serine hydrolase domain-containing protein [Cryptosporangium aurantiacum]SHN29892.1 CubicO group peptidase, beta-lactamase class C family [Cryptosporangium aurantiacum]
MTTSRRAALGLLGAGSLAATGGLAVWTAGGQPVGAHPTRRVPAGLRPGGELDKLIAGMADRDVFSGSVLITHEGRTVLSRSYGMADKARSVSIKRDTLFGLASVAKLFTAVAVAQLAQRGTLNYNDTIGAHLDGFPAKISDHVTLHHLLTHTSGLGDFFGDPGFFDAARTWTSVQQQTDAMAGFVRKETPAFAPGAGSRYSNSGYFVLEQIVARVSGQTFHDYVREHIVRPAGMGDAGYYTVPQIRANHRIAHGYYRPKGSKERIDNTAEQMFLPGAFATCDQMARFAHALWEERLLNPAYTRLVLSPKLPSLPPPGASTIVFTGYGPGITLAGDRWSYGYNGAASNGAVAVLEFYPDSGYVTVILSNYEMESIRGIPSLARKLIVGS